MMEIKEVDVGSIAYGLGVRAGDTLYSLNGHGIGDQIDLAFWEAEAQFNLEVGRNAGRKRFKGRKLPEQKLGIHLTEFEFKRCNNRCIFCFYDQMPPGMRKSLYERDDDFRLSFLYGNYITLTNMDEEEFERISEQQLSPLYISVHSTVDEVRRRLLGGKGGVVPIMPLLERLADAGIEMHTQVVICPGINDGRVLERTVGDLAVLFPEVRSIGIVPVGLTRYRKGLFPLQEVDKRQSVALMRRTLQWQDTFRRRFGMGFVYPSDEIPIKGGLEIPMKERYDGFPQLENGIGSSRLFLDGIEEMSTDAIGTLQGSLAIITGMLAHPWLTLLKERLEEETMLNCHVMPVTNSLFGESVTVSGLLGGEDVSRAISACRRDADLFLIPTNCLNEFDAFIDDVTLDEIRRRTGKRILAVPPDPVALPAILLQEFSR